MTVIMKRSTGYEGGFAFLECNTWEEDKKPPAMVPVLLKLKHKRKETVKVAHLEDARWLIHGIELEDEPYYHPIGWAEIPEWCGMFGFDEVME